MGTVFEVHVVDDVADGAVGRVFDWWRAVEGRFSTFLDGSEISRIGRGELAVDDSHPDVRHVLASCAEIEAASGGRFCVRPELPGGPGLDPAGFVKGWSVDEAALMLRAAGAFRFAIYAGGDVLCSGGRGPGEAWRVGLRLPWARDSVGAIVSVTTGSVATSGEYERGEHIWGLPAGEREVVGVSVVGPNLGVADALATAVYADQARDLTWFGAFPAYEVVMFTSSGEVRWSAGLAGRIETGDQVSA